MSKIIASGVMRGTQQIVGEAEKFWERARQDKGEGQKVEFPETAFYLPMACALMGLEVKTIGEMKPVLAEARSLVRKVPSDKVWLPYLGDALDCGIATLLAEEVIAVLRYLYKEEPQKGCEGFFSDTQMRQLGIQLVDGRMPGFAAILGAAPDTETAVAIVRECQKRSLLVFAGASSNGKSIVDQLAEANVETGWDNYIVPFGRDTISTIFPLNWAIRSALTFGGISKGNAKQCLLYCKDRVFAFALALGEVDDLKYATAAGAIDMGFPVIADTHIPEIKPTGICTYEHVVTEFDYKKIVPRAVEVRGVKVKVAEIDIPVSYAAAFEGERVRKEDMHVQFGSKFSKGVEFLKTLEADAVEDARTEVFGPDIDTVKEGGAIDLAIVIEVAGRKMRADFEGILERQIHRYLNHAMGVMHTAQRDQIWVRVSKDALKSGFRLKHMGTILHAMLHEEYGGIVDKVQVKIYTDPAKVAAVLAEATPVFAARDSRVAGMTDESTDTFYSCTLCQSFAPNHVCMITPERLGLCGAYNWLDGQASYEIKPTGHNQPVKKGRAIDEKAGEWEGVNEFVYTHSNRSVSRFSAYSMMQNVMTSCGCFEVIVGIIPEANGVMAVNREYAGDTPIGMRFSTLAGSVGGGAQTPGFIGVGRLYLSSKKFISAEGGLKRLVWLPKALKDANRAKLDERAKEFGIPGFVDMIGDETIATDAESLLKHLEKVGHPALTMDPLV
ncbi:MAG: acetyl-CoA decarbonylase/synthase complex subunit alpha/beta [Candidatus Coatesbacteria bacterium]